MSVYNRHFRHLSDSDTGILLEWLHLHAKEILNIQFDIPIGTGTDPGSPYDDNIRRMAILLSQRRIDAVADTADFTWIIEICHTATYRAAGQLEVYSAGYLGTYPAAKPIRTLLLCRKISDVDAAGLRAAGHTLAIFPELYEPTPPPDHPTP